MRNYIHISLITFLLLVIGEIQGQVNIGGDAKPEPFAVLQIDDGHQGGLRLPRLTSTEIVSLEAKIALNNDAAKGLMIYNATDNHVSYWNGTKWAALTQPTNPSITADNGIVADNSQTAKTVSLGGSLKKSTAIDVKDFQLNFSTTATETFSVGSVGVLDKGLNVAKGSVAMGALPISGTSPALRLSTTDNGAFKLTDGSEKVSGIKILTSDANGYGKWTVLPEYTSTIVGKLVEPTDNANNNTNISGSNGSSSNSMTSPFPISEVMTLGVGKWIVTANITTRNTNNRESTEHYTWMYLKDEDSGEWLDITGLRPEKNLGYSLSFPYIAYNLNTTTPRRVRLYAYSGFANTYVTTFLSSQKFYAVKLED